MSREMEPASADSVEWASRFRAVDVPEVPGMSCFEQLDDNGRVAARIWVGRSAASGAGHVRDMILAGAELSAEEVAAVEGVTIEEEQAFQQGLSRIRDAGA